MNWIIFALLYVIAGGIIGSVYAWMTGASGPTHAEVVALAATFGPALLLVMYGFREAARRTGIPMARAFYHTLLITFAAPMLCFGLSLLCNALGCLWFARLFKGLSYWSIPLTFVTAASYGLWRATRAFDRRLATGSTRGPDGSPPTGDSSSRSSAAPTSSPAGETPPSTLQRVLAPAQ